MVGALLATTSNAPVSFLKEPFASAISTYVDKVAAGNVTTFANLLQVRSSTVWQWRCGGTLPQLGTLVMVAATLNTSLFDLLMGEVSTITITLTMGQAGDVTPKKSRKWRRSKTTKRRAREALEAVIRHPEDSPASLPEVASRLKYDYQRLRKDFPDLCQAISAHYAHYRAKQRVERQQRLCEEVRQAVQSLHAQNCYPSRRQVSRLLANPGVFWNPEASQVWKETVQQLEWQQ
jgi:hypothetical protein